MPIYLLGLGLPDPGEGVMTSSPLTGKWCGGVTGTGWIEDSPNSGLEVLLHAGVFRGVDSDGGLKQEEEDVQRIGEVRLAHAGRGRLTGV